MDHSEVKKVQIPELRDFTLPAIRAYVEQRAAQYAAKGRKVAVVCGAIVEEGDPAGALNLRVRDEIAEAMTAAKRAGR